LKKAEALHGKVEEVAGYGKVTVEALGRLETRLPHPDSNDFEMRTSRSFSSIGSQLSRIESLLSTVSVKKPSQLPRNGSMSSLHSTNLDFPEIRSGSRRDSTSPSPIASEEDIPIARSLRGMDRRASVDLQDPQQDEAFRLVFHLSKEYIAYGSNTA
jgi:hypothetical protein